MCVSCSCHVCLYLAPLVSSIQNSHTPSFFPKFNNYCTVNIYAVQQDTQSVLMSEFYSALMLARHVSDLTGPSSYNSVTAGRVEQYAYYHIPNLRIQLVQNAPEDGPVRSETCRANIRDE